MFDKAKHIEGLWKAIVPSRASTAGGTGNASNLPPPGSYQLPNYVPSSMFTAYTTTPTSGDTLLDIALLYILFSRPEDIIGELKLKVMALLKDTKVNFIYDSSSDYPERVLFQKENKNIVCVDAGEFSTLYCEEVLTPDAMPRKYNYKFHKIEGLIAWINNSLSEKLTPQDELIKKIQKLCTP